VTPNNQVRASGRGRRKTRKRRARNRIVVGIAVVVAFGVGIALGQALHDNPKPGEQTSVVTIPPLTRTTQP
jgi:hypothetical protein